MTWLIEVINEGEDKTQARKQGHSVGRVNDWQVWIWVQNGKVNMQGLLMPALTIGKSDTTYYRTYFGHSQ